MKEITTGEHAHTLREINNGCICRVTTRTQKINRDKNFDGEKFPITISY